MIQHIVDRFVDGAMVFTEFSNRLPWLPSVQALPVLRRVSAPPRAPESSWFPLCGWVFWDAQPQLRDLRGQ
jgi:hypothetical protein